MKPYHLLIVLCLVYMLASCTKKNNNGEVVPLSLAGKWNLVIDSLVSGVGAVDPKTHIGVQGDYFDFRADGKCYVKEGNLYDTLAYHITSDTTLKIDAFGYGNNAFYTKPANPYLKTTLSSGGPYPPGLVNIRQVRLARQ